jgi:D-galactonate transporter
MQNVDEHPAIASALNSVATSNLLQKAYKRVKWRLIPFLFFCYVVAYLDRVNVGFAKLSMSHDLRFSETVYGIGAGIFFIGYFLFEIPSNILLSRIGARIWMARIMVTWGIISGCMMFVTSAHGFYITRFLLGLAEAGLFPGVILYLTYWFPSARRAQVVALFMAAQPVSGILGGPLSGWILQSFSSVHDLRNWQWLFLIEAIPSIIMGVVMFFYLDDGIRPAKWLSEEEKQLLEEAILQEASGKEHQSIAEVVRNPRVLFLCLIHFCIIMGLYGVGFWLPSIISTAGVVSALRVGELTAIPYLAAVVSMILISKSADRHRERRWHLAIPAVLAAVGLFVSTTMPHNIPVAIAGLAVAMAGIITCLPLFWSLPTAFLGGAGAAAGIALINSVGNLAGFVSPYLVGWVKDLTGSTNVGLYVISVSLILGGTFTLMLPARLVNK